MLADCKRACVAVLCAFLALVPLLSSADQVFEEHEYCAEHEAVEHLSTTVSSSNLAAGQLGRAALSEGGRLPVHAACPFVGVASHELRAAAPAISLPAPSSAVEGSVAPLTSQCHGGQLSVLTAAPKQSPPSHLV